MAEYLVCVAARDLCEINKAVALPVVDDLRSMLSKLESRMAVLEKSQAPAAKTVTVTKVDMRS